MAGDLANKCNQILGEMNNLVRDERITKEGGRDNYNEASQETTESLNI